MDQFFSKIIKLNSALFSFTRFPRINFIWPTCFTTYFSKSTLTIFQANLIYRRIDKISFLPLFIRLSNLKQRNFEILYRDLQIDFNSTSEYFRIENGGRKKVTCERCSTCSQFPLAEVVRRTIAARMWSIVSSHRTTCMTHFRVHVYRLT